MASLNGKSIIVTGAGSGIGRGAAVAMARGGGRVIVADINEKDGQDTVSLVRNVGGEAHFVYTDVTVDADVKNMVEAAVSIYGQLDGAFNNAGAPPSYLPFLDAPFTVWEKNISINLTAVYLCMRHEIAAMLKTGGGAIANTASVAGIAGLPLSAEYCASKHGVIGLTKAIAIEFGKRNIRVNAILPAGIDTPMRAHSLKASPGLGETRTAQYAMGRLGAPEEVGGVAAWLLSEEASYVTGVCVATDGGMSAGYS
jgi:2,5-dichloro-2,5-cyclohexadiene-1,4-diol dehydrogenase 1